MESFRSGRPEQDRRSERKRGRVSTSEWQPEWGMERYGRSGQWKSSAEALWKQVRRGDKKQVKKDWDSEWSERKQLLGNSGPWGGHWERETNLQTLEFNLPAWWFKKQLSSGVCVRLCDYEYICVHDSMRCGLEDPLALVVASKCLWCVSLNMS